MKRILQGLASGVMAFMSATFFGGAQPSDPAEAPRPIAAPVEAANATRLEAGLVGHWKLRVDCRDYSGHANHGVNHGVVLENGDDAAHEPSLAGCRPRAAG
jgi:hypothetical protein